VSYAATCPAWRAAGVSQVNKESHACRLVASRARLAPKPPGGWQFSKRPGSRQSRPPEHAKKRTPQRCARQGSGLHVRPVIVHAAKAAARQARGLTDNGPLRQPPPSRRSLRQEGNQAALKSPALRFRPLRFFCAAAATQVSRNAGHAQIKLRASSSDFGEFSHVESPAPHSKNRMRPALPARKIKRNRKVSRGTHETRGRPVNKGGNAMQST
jgi:hypothetical protein